MPDEKSKEELLAALQERLEDFESFLDQSFQDLLNAVPIEEVPIEEDDPNIARLLAVSIRTAGTAEAFNALAELGPYGLLFFMMSEGERLIEGVRMQQDASKRRQEILETECADCKDKDDCAAYRLGSASPPVDKDGNKILN